MVASSDVQLLGVDLTSAQVDYLVELADLDGNGDIDYQASRAARADRQEFAMLRQSTKLECAREVLKVGSPPTP